MIGGAAFGSRDDVSGRFNEGMLDMFASLSFAPLSWAEDFI
jgi:hypothetical protein